MLILWWCVPGPSARYISQISQSISFAASKTRVEWCKPYGSFSHVLALLKSKIFVFLLCWVYRFLVSSSFEWASSGLIQAISGLPGFLVSASAVPGLPGLFVSALAVSGQPGLRSSAEKKDRWQAVGVVFPLGGYGGSWWKQSQIKSCPIKVKNVGGALFTGRILRFCLLCNFPVVIVDQNKSLTSGWGKRGSPALRSIRPSPSVAHLPS